MKNSFKLLLGLICSSGFINAQEVELLNANGYGSAETDFGTSVCTDGSDNFIAVGGFRDVIDFDPGAGTADLTSNLGSEDIYVVKYNADGDFVWGHSFGSFNHERAEDVVTDAADNIYVTGRFFGTVDFDPGAGTTELVAPGGTSDVFVLKLDSDGNFIWAKNVGGTSTDQGLGVTVSASGNVFLIGAFQGTADFDPGAGVYELTAVDGSPNTSYILKLDGSGNFQWAKAFSGDSGNNFPNGLVVDAAENCYVTGSFAGTGDLDPGLGVVMTTTAGYDDIFAMKLNASGDYIWGTTIGGAYGEWAEDITLDASGDLILTGYFRLTVDFDPGAGTAELTATGGVDAFILKMTTDGGYVWAKQVGGASSDATGYTLVTDADDNCYIGGKYSGSIDFDPSASENMLTAAGSQDIFVLKLSDLGEYEWVKSMGGEAEEFGGAGIALDSEDNVYLTGGFGMGADFNPSGAPWVIDPVGGLDIFMVKFGACGIDNNVSQDLATLTADQAGATYQWLDCNAGYSTITDATAQSYEALIDGNYAVEITIGACVDTSACMLVSGVGINEFGAENHAITLYPNPASTFLTLQSNAAIVEILIYDAFGKLIQVENQTSFSIAALSKGIYTVIVKTENTIQSKRFVKV